MRHPNILITNRATGQLGAVSGQQYGQIFQLYFNNGAYAIMPGSLVSGGTTSFGLRQPASAEAQQQQQATW
jgi:hypothetical protein